MQGDYMPGSSATKQHPLWLTFKESGLEQEFAWWHTVQMQKVLQASFARCTSSEGSLPARGLVLHCKRPHAGSPDVCLHSTAHILCMMRMLSHEVCIQYIAYTPAHAHLVDSCKVWSPGR